jgi:hypothetical protein
MNTPKYCVYTNNKGERILGIARPGYFASDSFIENGNFDDILGDKFGIITGDDAKQYCVNKSRITSVEDNELSLLRSKCCPLFLLIEKIVCIEPTDPKAQMNIAMFWALNAPANMLEMGYSIEQIRSHFLSLSGNVDSNNENTR